MMQTTYLKESPHRSLMCAGAVILMACSSVWIQLRRLINTGHGNFIDDSNELLPTQSTINKTVFALSLTLNFLTHSDNPKNSKYRGTVQFPLQFSKGVPAELHKIP
jgi:hypothetical protein